MQSNVLDQNELAPQTRAFYCEVLNILSNSQIPFLIGGGFAFSRYTGIARQTKDLDLFVRPDDCPHILEVLSQNGYRTELTASQWLGKAFCGEDFVDIIFNSANGVSEVDELWFEHAVEDQIDRKSVV